jgi:transmembrane sensor
MAWLSLLSSGRATQADGEAFKRWVGVDAEHAQAFAKASHVWNGLRSVAESAVRPSVGAIAISKMTRRAMFGGAAAAMAASAAYAAVHPPLALWPSLLELAADVRTATGERRQVQIADGITIELNTRSSLSLRANARDGRYVELVSGETAVAVGPQADGPYIVAAGAGRVVARNASFDIRRDGDHKIRVACLDGSIQVEHDTQTVKLEPNRMISYDQTEIGKVEIFDRVQLMAWQQGRLLFRQTPLSEVVAEVNRYRPGLLVLMDDSLATRLIDASFQINRLDNVMIYLQQAFDVRVRRLPGSVVLIG